MELAHILEIHQCAKDLSVKQHNSSLQTELQNLTLYGLGFVQPDGLTNVAEAHHLFYMFLNPDCSGDDW